MYLQESNIDNWLKLGVYNISLNYNWKLSKSEFHISTKQFKLRLYIGANPDRQSVSRVMLELSAGCLNKSCLWSLRLSTLFLCYTFADTLYINFCFKIFAQKRPSPFDPPLDIYNFMYYLKRLSHSSYNFLDFYL